MHKKRFQICIYTVSRVSFDGREATMHYFDIESPSTAAYICTDVSIFLKINP